jgi:single-stranded DNA-binding protein
MQQRGEVTFWLGVVAFGKQADALAGHVKGDLVSVAGPCRSISGRARMAVHSKAIR